MKSPWPIMFCLLPIVSGCSHQNVVSASDQKALVQMEQEEKYSTVASAEAAIQQNPNNALAHHCLAEDLAGHDVKRCIDEFKIAVRLDPGDRKGLFELAYELRRSNQGADAKAIYSELAKTDDSWGQSSKRDLKRYFQS